MSTLLMLEATPEHLEMLQRAEPRPNPFFSPNYVAAAATLGLQPSVLATRTDDGGVSGAVAYIRSGRLSRSMLLEPSPSPAPDSPFWTALPRFCSRERIGRLFVSAFCARGREVPRLPGEMRRAPSDEFELDLRCDPAERMTRGHRKQVRTAGARGLTVECSETGDAVRSHFAMVAASRERRRQRGERPAQPLEESVAVALLTAGAARLYLTRLEGVVVGSALLVVGDGGAYYLSAGAAPAGLKIAAPYFLWARIAELLRAEGVVSLNLGGVPPEADGLRHFKNGFGAHPFRCNYVQALTGGPLQRGGLLLSDWWHRRRTRPRLWPSGDAA